MFDKLDDLLIRFEELMSELQEPDVANDQNRFRKLMKEQSDLAPIVEVHTMNIRVRNRQSQTVKRCWRWSLTKRCANLQKRSFLLLKSVWKSWSMN